MTNDEAIKRARLARELQENPLMQEARDHIEAECWRLFKELKPTDTEALAQVSGMQYLHGKYAAFFRRVIDDGKLAQLEIERARKPGLLERLTK